MGATMTDHGPQAVRAADAFVATLVNESAALPAGSIRIVDAPAGAGKTGLVTRLIPAYARSGHSVAVVTQTNEQADDLTRRLATEQPGLGIVRLVSAKHTPQTLPNNVSVQTNPTHALGQGPVVATADKWAFSVEALGGTRFRVGIIDEAYQMAGGKLLYIADLFESLDLVGDPGQLSPFSQVDTSPWAGLAVDPHGTPSTPFGVTTTSFQRQFPSHGASPPKQQTSFDPPFTPRLNSLRQLRPGLDAFRPTQPALPPRSTAASISDSPKDGPCSRFRPRRFIAQTDNSLTPSPPSRSASCPGTRDACRTNIHSCPKMSPPTGSRSAQVTEIKFRPYRGRLSASGHPTSSSTPQTDCRVASLTS